VQVKMLTSIAGERWSALPGQIIEIDKATAIRLIKTGQAVEVAIKPEPENAARQTTRAKRRKAHV